MVLPFAVLFFVGTAAKAGRGHATICHVFLSAAVYLVWLRTASFAGRVVFFLMRPVAALLFG